MVLVVIDVCLTKVFDTHRVTICPEFKLFLDPLNLTNNHLYVIAVIAQLSKVGI